MDTSSVLIGLLITFLMIIPVAFVIRSNYLCTNKIKEIKSQYSNNHYKFDLTETSNKKIMNLDPKNKGFLFIDFSYKEKEKSYFIDLKTIVLCNTIVTKGNNLRDIIKVEIELVYKDNMKKEIIPIYNIENNFLDLNCLYEDHKFAVKWVNLINDCLI